MAHGRPAFITITIIIMISIPFHLAAYIIIVGWLVFKIIHEFITTRPDHYVGRPFVLRYILYIIIVTLLYGGLYWY